MAQLSRALLPCIASITSVAVAQCTDVWQSTPALDGAVRAAVAWDPDGGGRLGQIVVVAGDFVQAGGVTVDHIAAWDPQTASWVSLAGGMNGNVYDLVALPNGELIAAGSFTMAGGVAAEHIARWNGSTWAPLGAGVDGFVASMVALPDGELAIAGSFTTVGGVLVGRVARWDGASWHPVGSDTGAVNPTLGLDQNGDLLASDYGIGIRRWDGTNWSDFAPGLSNVTAMTVLSDGRFVAAGTFVGPSGPNVFVMRWNGTNWVPIGNFFAPFGFVRVEGLLELPNGDLVAHGSFNWISVPPTSAVQVGGLSRWNGSAWSSMGSLSGPVYASAFLPQGELFAGGSFLLSPGVVSYVARLVTPCPAQAVNLGGGCTGSSGNNDLAADTPPWIGATFRAHGSGLPALAFVSQVYGFAATQVPLSMLLPQGVPGCDLLVTPDHVTFSIAMAGEASTELWIPANASLVGVTFRHQLNLLEVDAALNLLAVTASNSLELTIGAF